MDNFMDKLAKRFNAGEIIKANAQAEARDMKRMQERTAEYERMMQEMRRLNLKNVEMTEQVQQLIQCGIEQFEGYGSGDAILADKIAQAGEASDNGFVRMDGKLDEVERTIRDLMAGLETQLKANDDMDIAFERLETVIATNRYSTEEGIRQVSDTVAQAQASVEQMQSVVAQMEEIIRTTREILVATRMSVEEGHKHLEEHIHKENVRVYRNVQAVVIEEATKKARDMGARLDQLENGVKKTNGLKPLVTVTFLMALASVVLQVLQILQIL